jgi:hypothetical protein|tara:strand:- start:17000 stop:19375 length:2376 start_codon:yes stop_codon:yes gene_type:complete
MADAVINNFPTQVVPDAEKISYEYGLKIAKAIEDEWFSHSHEGQTRGTARYSNNQTDFHRLRLYARGEQSVKKYKDELAINGDLSYLNLDWKPVPIVPKFVDIVVNGMADRTYEIQAFSQDPYGVAKRTEYMESILRDMKSKEFNDAAKANFNMDLYENDKETLPETEQELELHMQLTYKQATELANEQAINVLLEGSNYDLIRKRLYYDLTVLGIGAVKTSFNTSEGVVVDYVDPANIVYSHTNSPYFDDIYYVGEVKSIPINELVKQFPHLSNEDLEEIQKKSSAQSHRYNNYKRKNDFNQVDVLYFNYKTYMNEVYKLKETSTGGEKAIEKDDQFNPPTDKVGGYAKLSTQVEVLFEGALILGSDKLIKWELAENMMRPKSDYTKVKMNYSIVAPRIYQGRIESIVSRITGFADMIQLTHLKLQQVMSRMVPDGVYLDADGLAEVDLGNGTNYNPQEALNMFFQTGSIIGRSFTGDGDPNPGKVPIQEISNGAGAGNKMQTLIANYNYYLQMIRDVTGLNEARDGSMPDRNALVGVQKLAAANSNTATRHVLQGGLFITKDVAEQLSLRISDIIEYSPTKDAFLQQIGTHNVATLEEMSELHLYDFGIFIELEPDEEEKQLLEQNIQMALAQKLIRLSDAIDVRNTRNVKLANELLKIKEKKKVAEDQAMQQQNIQAQQQAAQQTAQVQAQAEAQKQQTVTQSQIQLEQAKAEFKAKNLDHEAQTKMKLMEFEFNLKMQQNAIENKYKEDRADNREEIKGENAERVASKKFESAGNDELGTGLNMNQF